MLSKFVNKVQLNFLIFRIDSTIESVFNGIGKLLSHFIANQSISKIDSFFGGWLKSVYNNRNLLVNGRFEISVIMAEIMFSPEILLTLNLNQHRFVDPRRIALLKAIEQTGSLSQAAKQVGMSYKTAWDAINEMNALAPTPFFITSIGGKKGGGTKLSSYAVRFIQLYELLTQLQQNAFNILSDDKVPLDDILKTTAKLSLQTSARNQLYGSVKQLEINEVAGYVTVLLSDNQTELKVNMTQSSVQRLKLSLNKTVMLLIKAPSIEFNHLNENCLSAKVVQIKSDEYWSEIQLLLPSGLAIYATKLTQEIEKLAIAQDKQIMLSIDPQQIIVATLI